MILHNQSLLAGIRAHNIYIYQAPQDSLEYLHN